jgi:hypothetical protein
MQKHRLVSIGIAVLAVVQGLFGVLRGFDYVRMGGELAAQGIILRPLLGAVAYGRGGLIILVALLSFIFAAGTLLGKSSVWWCGLIAAVLNIILVLGILTQGEHIAELMLWLVVPVLVIWFLFSRFGWQSGHGSDETTSS